jgi:hypothetical protein
MSLRIEATVLSLTTHRRAISPFDHFDHSSSPSRRRTALRLSALDLRRPWVAFAPAECRIASRRVPERTLVALVYNQTPIREC